MKLLDKFKELFVEDEEESKEVEKGYTREIKIEQEVKVEKEKDEVEVTLTEREIYKSEPTFKFPAIYEEEDMMPKPEPRRPYVYDRPKFKNKEEEKEDKKFVASPIISPVYGILDKNYKKDEISNKSDHPEYEDKRNYKKMDVDVIRQKAYGTLEEDIEHTIMGDNGFIYGSTEEEVEEPKEDPIIQEMGLTDSPKEDVSIEQAFENYSDYGVEYNNGRHASKDEEETEEAMQKTEVLDNDLYDLINSMYKDDEEEKEDDK